MTCTQDVTGRQLPLVTVPACELEDDWLHAMGPHLPGFTMAAKKGWKNTVMLAGVTDCGRSQKWGCRGRLVLGYKPRHGSHAGGLGPHSIGKSQDHTTLGRSLPPRGLGCRRDLAGKVRGERTIAGGP